MQKTAYDMRRSDGSSDVGSSDLLTRIVFRSASILGTPIDAAGAAEIARRSRGTPRITNRLLRRARDYAEVRGDGQISASLAGEAMKLQAVDSNGFDLLDRKLLMMLIERFDGGPAGPENLAPAIRAARHTITYLIEPCLTPHKPQSRMQGKR